MLIDREVEADTCKQLIGPIQQHELATGTLRIAVQDVAAVGRNVDVLAQSAINEQDQTKVADVATGTRAALQLIKA